MVQRIPLPNGMAALVDEADFARLSGFRWRAERAPSGATYAVRSIKNRRRFLHREIMDPEGKVGRGLLVDHIDGDTLNCLRSNLRWVSPSASNRNRSVFRTNRVGYKGVVFDTRAGCYVAQIAVSGRLLRVKGHPTPEEAALAYNEMALRLHGEHARLNVVPKGAGVEHD